MNTEDITVDRKEKMDALIKSMKQEKPSGYLRLDKDFTVGFDYIDDPALHENHQGFFITVLPRGRDGIGCHIKFDPYDLLISSGVPELVKENI